MWSGSEEGSYLRRIDFVYHSTLGFRVMKKKDLHEVGGRSARPLTGLAYCLWTEGARKVDIWLPGKGISNSHSARPVHQIIWIRTSRLSIKRFCSQRHSPSGFRMQGSRCRVQVAGCRVQTPVVATHELRRPLASLGAPPPPRPSPRANESGIERLWASTLACGAVTAACLRVEGLSVKG